MKIPFLFGIHCHQPAENFYNVVDWAIEQSYAPFLEAALKSKKFKFSAHYSGWLLEYIRTHRKDVFDNLKKLSDDGRVEFFTGGFYEPILSSIPSDDRRGQIKMLSDYIQNHFGRKPAGLWLTERVWDPAIIPDLYECGVRHAIVDDYHLIAAGFPKESLTGYFRTEQDGCPLNIFPIDMGLRYLIPFKPEDAVVRYILDAKSRNVKLISCFDDGEKFGIWPDTYEWVYKKGWLKRFMKAVEKEKEIEFMHYEEAAEKFKPSGIAYLPITSYEEMGEWSLFSDQTERFDAMKDFMKTTPFADDTQRFLKGSVWKNFLVKYPESNRLNKRTTDLSLRGRKYKSDKKFLDALYRSQCNDSLWHGVFGGLYLPNLRNNAWASLIDAETQYEKLAGIKIPSMEIYDIDRDGFDEIYARNNDFNCMFVSRDFGQMTALELKKEKFNLLNVISRKKEAYHKKLLKNIKSGDHIEETGSAAESIHDKTYSITADTAERITYDWYNKNCFIDHFMEGIGLNSYEKCAFHELSDFTNQPADTAEISGENIIFKKCGGIYINGERNKTDMEKVFTFNKNAVDFHIKAKSSKSASCEYAQEFNFHFADVSKLTVNNKAFTEKGEMKSNIFEIYDEYLNKRLVIQYEKEIKFIWFTIHTVSQSEMGVDLTVQGITVAAVLPYGKELDLKGTLRIG